jgi:flavin-dependent dehydrogenase
LLSNRSATQTEKLGELVDGSRVGVVGGGPAGSFFTYFLLRLADRVGLTLHVDIFEPRNFDGVGPKSCNMCGGIISESLVQNLAAEGVRLPPNVVQRSLNSYCLHTDVGDAQIATPQGERRIAAVHRGCGPRDLKKVTVRSFDAFLLEQAVAAGARHVRTRVLEIGKKDGQNYLQSEDGQQHTYDLVAVATGINAPAVKFRDNVIPGYSPPGNTKTYISEACFFSRDMVKSYLGSSMHVFLLHIPRLEFAAIIPKGEYATICLLGEDINKELVRSFMEAPEVRSCFPPGWQQSGDYCHCSPRINIRPAHKPFAKDIVFIGDCGTSRLYKDGIGAAYRTAKAAATTAIFHGTSKEDFRRHYQPVCDALTQDNNIGKFIFLVTRTIQNYKFLRRGLCRMVTSEQRNGGRRPRMSSILWNTFTGSAPYRDILLNALHPAFLLGFAWNIIAANLHEPKATVEGG